MEDVLGLGRHELFKPNIQVSEQLELQSLANHAQEDLMAEGQQPAL